MKEKGSWWWAAAKLALTAVILAAVGRQLWLDLRQLGPDWPPIGWGWLALSAVLYLVGIAFSAACWHRLMLRLGGCPDGLTSARAYYISQLGKYVPGKALALVMRVGMATSPRTPAAAAALAAFVEVLATMASGAVVAAACSLMTAPGRGIDWPNVFSSGASHDPGRWELLLLSGGLLAVTLGPILPPVFNRLAAGVTRPFRTGPLPAVGWRALGEGLLITAPCWLFLGLGLGCGLRAAGAEPPPIPWLISALAIAYVLGFVVPISPGGLGVREVALALLLSPHLDRGTVALAVVLVRLAWTVAEGAAAAILYPLSAPRVTLPEEVP